MSLIKKIYRPLSKILIKLSLNELKARYTEGIDERMGNISAEKLSKLKGRPVWIHAVSVGEVQAASALIDVMRRDGFSAPIVISTTTETGKEMAEKLSANLFDLHIYYPWDSMEYVESALDKVNPLAFVVIETEIWPNMIWGLKERDIPVFLVNGRISDRSFRHGNNFIGRAFFKEMFNLFEKLYLRHALDVERLTVFGVCEDKFEVVGDIKTDAILARKNSPVKEKIASELHTEKSPLYVAGSTHTGEDEIAVGAFRKLREVRPDARLILAPRHTERSDELYEKFSREFKVCKYSALTEDWDIVIIDKIGILFYLYGISEASFVGGSFTDNGGQNILEPAAWGVPVQYGPRMEDFAEVSAEFIKRGISVQVSDTKGLAEIWCEVALNKIDREKVKTECEKYFAEKANVVRKSWKSMEKILVGKGIFTCGMFK